MSNLLATITRLGTYMVFLTKLRVEGGAHDLSPLVRRSLEVDLAGLSPGGRHILVVLHGCEKEAREEPRRRGWRMREEGKEKYEQQKTGKFG
jgi:hypothetical protein